MRNPTFDIMKGIGIIAVIIGHMEFLPFMPWRQICFSFHMPLFFLVAGYFYKKSDLSSELIKSSKRLLLPYFFTAAVISIPIIWSVILGQKDIIDLIKYAASVVFASGSSHNSLLLPDFIPIGAIWFLAALFWCKIAYNYIANKWKSKYLIASLIAIVATYIDYYIINLPFAILPGLSAMMYFAIGNLAKENVLPRWFYMIILVLYPISFYFCRIYMVQCHYDIYPLSILGSCGGVFIVYLISKQIAEHTSVLSNVLCYIGTISLVVLCAHLIEIKWDIYNKLNLSNFMLIQLLIRVLFPVLVAMICIKLKFIRYIFQIKI